MDGSQSALPVWELTVDCGFGVQRTRQAMTIVGINEDDQDAVFRTVAAVLHLGNVAFQEGADADASQVRLAGWSRELHVMGGSMQ